MQAAVSVSKGTEVVGEMAGAASMSRQRAAVAPRRKGALDWGRAATIARVVPARRMRRFIGFPSSPGPLSHKGRGGDMCRSSVALFAEEAGGLGDEDEDEDGEDDDVALGEEVDAAELVNQAKDEAAEQ